MSLHKVPVVVINEIKPHPNADKLEIALIDGWECVVQKDRFKSGQMAVYIPVDSILPFELEEKLFPPTAKIKLTKSRIRSIKIRGVVSQGLLLTPEELALKNYFEGQDLMEDLNIQKYEPPEPEVHMNPAKTAKRHKNKNFHEYTDLQNYKWYNRLFKENDQVVITEKLHGTSFRAGWVKRDNFRWWEKLLNKLGLLNEWQFCWGSRRVQIQSKLFHKGYYDEDVYTKMVKQYNLKNIIPKGIVIYGEIVGDKIQKNYTYGCKQGEHKLYIYDIMRHGKYLSYESCIETIEKDGATIKLWSPGFKDVMKHLQHNSGYKLNPVPLLHVGDYIESFLPNYFINHSCLSNSNIKEGVVIKSFCETETSIGRKILKVINPEYYLQKDNSDYH